MVPEVLVHCPLALLLLGLWQGSKSWLNSMVEEAAQFTVVKKQRQEETVIDELLEAHIDKSES